MLAIGKTTGNAKGAPMNNEMFNWQFKHTQYIPYDPSVDALYTGYTTHPALGGVQPFEYTGWRDEMLAAYETCYIHAGLNPAFTYRFKGADALRFLEENLVNGFKTFEVGKSRHGIMVNEDGLLMSDGMLLRIGEDEFTTYWLAPYL
jgi:glycine cleavage system aminomethyltransferase T